MHKVVKRLCRQSYNKFKSFMANNGYKKPSFDHCVFASRFSPNVFIVLLLYVDYMSIIGQDMRRISKKKDELAKTYDIKDLVHARQILTI